MGKIGRFFFDLYRDGWGVIGFIAPLVTAVMAVAKFCGVTMGDLQHISWAWVLAPITLWLLLAYTRRWIAYQQHFDANPQPDISAHDVFWHLIVDSKWSLGKSDAEGVSTINTSLFERTDMMLRSAAMDGRVSIWGRPLTNSARVQPFGPIPQNYWEQAGFDGVACWLHPDWSPRTWPYQDRGQKFEDVMFNSAQVLRCWPKADWLSRRRDDARKGRVNPYFDEVTKAGKRWRLEDI